MSRGSITGLIAELVKKVNEQVAGETFTKVDETNVEPVYTKVPVAAYAYDLPEEKRGNDKALPFPYLTVFRQKGREDESSGMMTVRFFIGLYGKTPAEGEADMERLIELLVAMAENQAFTSWSLEKIDHGPVDEDGGQPYPELFDYVDLSFMRQSAFNNS